MHRDPDPQDDCNLFTASPHVGRKDCKGDGHYMCPQCRRWNPDYERKKKSPSPRVKRLLQRAMFLELLKDHIWDFTVLIRENIFSIQEAHRWKRRIKINHRALLMEQGWHGKEKKNDS